MMLYLLREDLDFGLLRSVDDTPELLHGGVPVTILWKDPILAAAASSEQFVPVDCLSLNAGIDGPILSNYARYVLNDILLSAGQWLPVMAHGYQYWWFNCLAYVDALDIERTEAEWDEVSGKWGSYRWISVPRALEFKADMVASAPAMFRVRQFPRGVLFVNETFCRAVAQYELVGFRIDKVWSSIDGAVRNPPGFEFCDALTDSPPEVVLRKRARAEGVLQRRQETAEMCDAFAKWRATF
jgi:hypothetical protein